MPQHVNLRGRGLALSWGLMRLPVVIAWALSLGVCLHLYAKDPPLLTKNVRVRFDGGAVHTSLAGTGKLLILSKDPPSGEILYHLDPETTREEATAMAQILQTAPRDSVEAKAAERLLKFILDN